MKKGNTPGYEFHTTIPVEELDKLSSFERIKANHAKLDACPRHDFGEIGEVTFGMKLTCKRCGGEMHAIRANDYARGYEAAGGNPDEIIANFKEGQHGEEAVTCPVCNGVCGVDVAVNMNEGCDPQDDCYAPDWHDCDFCDATGTVARIKALAYIDETNKPKEYPP